MRYKKSVSFLFDTIDDFQAWRSISDKKKKKKKKKEVRYADGSLLQIRYTQIPSADYIEVCQSENNQQGSFIPLHLWHYSEGSFLWKWNKIRWSENESRRTKLFLINELAVYRINFRYQMNEPSILSSSHFFIYLFLFYYRTFWLLGIIKKRQNPWGKVS